MKTHGMRYSREYASWIGMKGRCLNPTNKDYVRWGAKGITIYAAWVRSFVTFYRYLGPKPPGSTLERKNTTKGYVPGNVKWALPVDQARNRTTSKVWTIRGRKFASAQDAAGHFGVSDVTIHRWAKGSYDERRGTFTKPKAGCSAELRY